MSFQVEAGSGRQQAAVTQDADGFGISGARQFRWVADGPQEFQAAGEAGRLLTRQGCRNGITLGQ